MEFLYLIVCVLAFVGGLLLSRVIHPELGQLEVDESDPSDVKWRFVLTKEVDFTKTKFIFLRVNSRK